MHFLDLHLNFLDFIFLISGFYILFFAIDLVRKERFSAFYFVIFMSVGAFLILLTLFPEIRDFIGKITGISRGADALVYISIIFLFYFVLLLLRKVEKQREEISRLVREIALQNSKK